MWGRESPAAARAFHRGGTDAHLRERRGLRLSLPPGRVGCVQQLPAPSGPHRRRPLDLRHVGISLPGVQVRWAARRPATDRRGAHGQGGGGHRPNPGSRHRSRLERAARRRHALGAAPEARGERSRDRRASRRDRRPPHRGGVGARTLVGRQARRRALRGQQRPRPPLDGAPPATSRRRTEISSTRSASPPRRWRRASPVHGSIRRS